MRIKCSSCNTVYKIPEERLPKRKKIAFPCPKCKGLIKIDLRSKLGGDSPPSNTAEKEPQNESVPSTPHVKDVLSGEDLKNNLLRSLKDLPPMPQVVFKAQEVMANQNSDLKELSKVIKTDMSITTKILRMANSAYYGLRGKVSSIEYATVLLGQNTLGEVVTMAGISDFLESSLKGYNLDSGDLWQHSMAVAFGSKIIAERKKPELANDAFTAGLLHDAGKIILDKPVLERKKSFEAFMDDEQHSILQAETEILGFDHSEIASEMCKKWNIPKTITLAIRFHHYPSRSEGDDLSYILHMADYIATLSGIGIGSDDVLYQLEDGVMGFLGLQQKNVSEIVLDVIESNNKII